MNKVKFKCLGKFEECPKATNLNWHDLHKHIKEYHGMNGSKKC